MTYHFFLRHLLPSTVSFLQDGCNKIQLTLSTNRSPELSPSSTDSSVRVGRLGREVKARRGRLDIPSLFPSSLASLIFLKNFIGIVEGASPVKEREFTVLLTQISIQCFLMPKIFSVFTCLSPGPEGQPDSLFAAFSLGLYTKTHFHRVRKKTRAYYCLRGNTEKIVKHR